MNYLNSILLEGKISEDPIMKMALGEERTELRVESSYVSHDCTIPFHLNVYCTGNLARRMLAGAKNGDDIRVVGKLVAGGWVFSDYFEVNKKPLHAGN